MERCKVSRSTLKSNVSPPTSPAGSSHPASVNWPPSQVYEAGRSRCWSSASNESGANAAPVEQVSEAAVGDHDVGKGVRPSRHDCERLLIRLGIKSELQHTDRLASTRHGSENPETIGVLHDLDVLLRERTTMRCAGSVLPVRARGLAIIVSAHATDVTQPDQCSATVVGDQEADITRLQRIRQSRGDDFCRIDRRSRFHGSEQRLQVQRGDHARSVTLPRRHSPTITVQLPLVSHRESSRRARRGPLRRRTLLYVCPPARVEDMPGGVEPAPLASCGTKRGARRAGPSVSNAVRSGYAAARSGRCQRRPCRS